MHSALEEARKAADKGEVPVGAVVVMNGTIIGSGHNLREHKSDPTAHAEILALKEAGRHLGSWRLEYASVFVTLEPCPMCAGALVNARVSELVFGCRDPKAGAVRSLYSIADDDQLNHRIRITEGLLEDECSRLMSDFFAALRESKKKT